jgi:hypothetical protein
MLKHVT